LFGALGGGLAGAGRAGAAVVPVVVVVVEGVLDVILLALLVAVVVVAVAVVVAVPFGRALAGAALVEVPTCPLDRLSVVGFESDAAGPSFPGR
jgi:hypothetical protein